MGEQEAGAGAKSAPAILTSDQIFESEDLASVTVDVPEWNGSVRIRELSRQEVLDAQANATADGDLSEEEYDLYLIVAALVEPRLAIDDISRLRKKNARAVQRLAVNVGLLINGGESAVEGAIKSDQQ